MGRKGLALLHPRRGTGFGDVTGPLQPFDPLDPQHRIEQQRERRSFFRQTDIFLTVIVTMAIFVPLAIWQKPWAIPFLGWMAFLPVLTRGVLKAASKLLHKELEAGLSPLVLAAMVAAFFLATAGLLGTTAVIVCAAVMFLAYVMAMLFGLIWTDGEDE